MRRRGRGLNGGGGGRSRARAAAAWLALAALPAAAFGGETRCWIDQGALIAPAAFGAIAGDFVIDLAAAHSRLSDSRANAQGLEGPTALAVLRLAGDTRPGFPMAIADLDPETRGFDTVVNGVLGADAFAGRVLEVSFSPCRLRVSHRPGRPWRGGARLTVVETGGVPLVQARLGDGVRVREALFALGTGRWASLISGARPARPPAAATAAADPAAEGAPVGAEDPPGRLRAVEFAGRLVEQAPARPTNEKSEGARGVLGLSVLSGQPWRWDQARRRLEVGPSGRPSPRSDGSSHRAGR